LSKGKEGELDEPKRKKVQKKNKGATAEGKCFDGGGSGGETTGGGQHTEERKGSGQEARDKSPNKVPEQNRRVLKWGRRRVDNLGSQLGGNLRREGGKKGGIGLGEGSKRKDSKTGAGQIRHL